jgi:hypothetical protein
MGSMLPEAQKNEDRQAFADPPAHASLNIPLRLPQPYMVAAKSQLVVLPLKMNARRITRTQTTAVALPQISQAGR